MHSFIQKTGPGGALAPVARQAPRAGAVTRSAGPGWGRPEVGAAAGPPPSLRFHRRRPRRPGGQAGRGSLWKGAGSLGGGRHPPAGTAAARKSQPRSRGGLQQGCRTRET